MNYLPHLSSVSHPRHSDRSAHIEKDRSLQFRQYLQGISYCGEEKSDVKLIIDETQLERDKRHSRFDLLL